MHNGREKASVSAFRIGLCSSLPPALQLHFMCSYLILYYCLIMCLCKKEVEKKKYTNNSHSMT